MNVFVYDLKLKTFIIHRLSSFELEVIDSTCNCVFNPVDFHTVHSLTHFYPSLTTGPTLIVHLEGQFSPFGVCHDFFHSELLLQIGRDRSTG